MCFVKLQTLSKTSTVLNKIRFETEATVSAEGHSVKFRQEIDVIFSKEQMQRNVGSMQNTVHVMETEDMTLLEI